MRVRVAGVLSETPALPGSGAFVLMPLAAVHAQNGPTPVNDAAAHRRGHRPRAAVRGGARHDSGGNHHLPFGRTEWIDRGAAAAWRLRALRARPGRRRGARACRHAARARPRRRRTRGDARPARHHGPGRGAARAGGGAGGAARGGRRRGGRLGVRAWCCPAWWRRRSTCRRSRDRRRRWRSRRTWPRSRCRSRVLSWWRSRAWRSRSGRDGGAVSRRACGQADDGRRDGDIGGGRARRGRGERARGLRRGRADRVRPAGAHLYRRRHRGPGPAGPGPDRLFG